MSKRVWLACMVAVFLGIPGKLVAFEPELQVSDEGQPRSGREGLSQSRKAEQARAERLKLMETAAAQYKLTMAGEPAVSLIRRPEPALRWTNPIRKTQDGIVVVWTHQGRPEAIVCIYTYMETGIDHEFQSLSLRPLIAEFEDRVVWTPAKAGVEFQAVPDAPPPAKHAALRQSQMRGLARRFTGLMAPQGKRRELRMLSQPIYRYELENSTELLDGAMFAFVQGTDPELLLLLEARRNGTGHQWQYAFGRMSSAPLQAEYRDKLVWSIERWDWQPDPRDPYITFVKRREPADPTP